MRQTMAEQNLPGEYENPYKFNAKKLDTETELYYYGARYYNPRLSVWYGVDPLAIWNPVMETEFYGDGQHNGGVYFWGNLNPYQNPIKFIDPNGKQVEWQKYWDQAKKQQDEKQHLILAFHRQYRTFADFGNLIPTISSHF